MLCEMLSLLLGLYSFKTLSFLPFVCQTANLYNKHTVKGSLCLGEVTKLFVFWCEHKQLCSRKTTRIIHSQHTLLPSLSSCTDFDKHLLMVMTTSHTKACYKEKTLFFHPCLPHRGDL